MRQVIYLRIAMLFLCCAGLFTACKKSVLETPLPEDQQMQAARNKNSYERNGNVIFYGLTKTNQVVKYATSKKLTEISAVNITGLQSGENILAIDFRPATGQLYGLGSTSRIYVINQNTGVARAINAMPFTPAIDGSIIGFDFNPTVDRIRLVTNNRQNLRLNPETGMVVATDGMINPGDPAINAVAYTNNFAGATTTTLYDIDINSDKLYIQTPPNNGTLSLVGSLEVDAKDEGGFDIGPDGTALAALYAKGDDDEDDEDDYSSNSSDGDNGNKYRLYYIDLQTGKAKNAGKFEKAIIGLAIPTNQVAYAVNESNNLLIFNPENNSAPITKSFTGLMAGETILGIDFRPVNGQLYGLSSSSRIYTINTSNGAATAVGGTFSVPLNGTSFGFDFNPLVDRIRIVSNAGQNLRVNPNDGVVVLTNGLPDGNLNPGMPMVSAAAYTNNFAGTTSTTLYDIDFGSDKLFIQNPPNSGTLVEVGALGVDVDAANGFDIGGLSNKAYALLSTGSTTSLYTINLATGAATPVSVFQEKARGFALGLGF